MVGSQRTFYEFFAGGGLARAGLGRGWRCAFANDIDPIKAQVYEENFGAADFRLADVHALDTADLPGQADLAWASSPCQDLSLAGRGDGLRAERSGAFWGFHRLMAALVRENRAPRVIAFENVCGLASRRGGADFAELIRAFVDIGYRAGALELDAAHFLPQSRPRLFVIAVRRERPIPQSLIGESPFQTPLVTKARAALPPDLAAQWVNWALPIPPARNTNLGAVLATGAQDWRSAEDTARLLSLLAPGHKAKLALAQETAATQAAPVYGTGYRRIRMERGDKRQRLELRFDGLAGCLRTPAGGSSVQMVVEVRPHAPPRFRTLSPEEAKRLMGLPERYRLPSGQSNGLKVLGDGVAVPVVAWLSQHLLRPLAGASPIAAAAE
ncbi:MAG: DNA cytosine methyltransferase [Maricaulaceae bacterium]